MNWKQAAKSAGKVIETLEETIKQNRVTMAFNKLDIQDYNKCIQHMINHGSPCEYCEDLEECKKAGKDVTIGCDEWMLKHQDITKLDVKEEDDDDSKGIYGAGSEG